MHQVSAYEAKTHLSQLLNRVTGGEHIVITKHGIPVAEIIPVRTVSLHDRHEAIEKLLTFSNGKLAGESLRTLIEEGRM